MRSSTARASARASSKRVCTTAFNDGLTRSILRIVVSTTSALEIERARIHRPSSVADAVRTARSERGVELAEAGEDSACSIAAFDHEERPSDRGRFSAENMRETLSFLRSKESLRS